MNQNDFRQLISQSNQSKKHENLKNLNKNDKKRLSNLSTLSNDIQLLAQSKGLNLDEINKQKLNKSKEVDEHVQSELDSVISNIKPPTNQQHHSNKRSRNDILAELKRSKLDHQFDDSASTQHTYKPPSPDALNSDDDIFNDTNDKYQPPILSDSDSNSDSCSHNNIDTTSKDIQSPFSQPQSPQISQSPLRKNSLSPSPSPELDISGRLVGLTSTALPNVAQRIQSDKDAEIADQRKQRKQIWLAKQGIKKDTGDNPEPPPQKTQTDSQKLNSDYQRSHILFKRPVKSFFILFVILSPSSNLGFLHSFNVRLFTTTETDEHAIANPAIIGCK
ncbi:hypothetical protein E3P96_03609 [Wallemia ichthyophaga]|nr:hypothetical protein E3P96_03609 [Wallemia ichthyophaga]